MSVVLINGETWAICGGRGFSNTEMFSSAMGEIVQRLGCPARVIHGDARGADQMTGEWGRRMAIGVVAIPADWSGHGMKAGPLRNQLMLDTYKPTVVVAFPGGQGTADMIRRSRRTGANVIEIKPDAPEPK